MRGRLPATIRDGAGWLRRFARTAPGRMGLVVVGLVIVSLVSGLVCANEFGDKRTRRDTVLQYTEPLANAAQRLYVALSAADAAASAAFLSGGIESTEVRTRYRQALADAAAALAEATAGASDSRTREIVARIAADLPTYTGLVESARANNRQGLPVGSAYLRQASELMQDTLLSKAQELEQTRLAALHEQQRVISGPPLLGVVLLVLLLIGCAIGSRELLRHTNRRVNLGVLTAGGAAALTLLWIASATIAATTAVDTGNHGATARFETLAKARILAQQARTEETLLLVTRGDVDASETRYAEMSTALRDSLLSVLSADSPATQAFSSWQDSHVAQIASYRGNEYNAAVQRSIGAGTDSAAARFAALDEALRTDLEQTRERVRDGVDAAGDALILAPQGTLVLLFAAAAAVVLGVWPRLKEFL
ncbi:hypothetical protein [Nocardia sp. NPDC057668]|uniref:hypothetical protein n=1 Tax=Nocardia sp. NPDC057668 TaxID=3346202 RepID=UPI00366E7BB5